MDTLLTVKVNIKQPLVSTTQPSKAETVATSVLKLDNGTFVLQSGTTLSLNGPVDINFPDLNTLEVVVKATQVSKDRRGLYFTSFPKGPVSIKGLKVELDTDPIALTGTMTHRMNTGTFSVATTGNPQGDTLENGVGSRILSLKP